MLMQQFQSRPLSGSAEVNPEQGKKRARQENEARNRKESSQIAPFAGPCYGNTAIDANSRCSAPVRKSRKIHKYSRCSGCAIKRASATNPSPNPVRLPNHSARSGRSYKPRRVSQRVLLAHGQVVAVEARKPARPVRLRNMHAHGNDNRSSGDICVGNSLDEIGIEGVGLERRNRARC